MINNPYQPQMMTYTPGYNAYPYNPMQISGTTVTATASSTSTTTAEFTDTSRDKW